MVHLPVVVYLRSESDGYMNFIQKSDASVIIQGEFSLESLSHFIKCTPLCTHLEMYLGNDLPLIVKYDVASLGEIKLCLAPLPPSLISAVNLYYVENFDNCIVNYNSRSYCILFRIFSIIKRRK